MCYVAGHLLLQLLTLDISFAGISLPHAEQQDAAADQQTSYDHINYDDYSLHHSAALKMYP